MDDVDGALDDFRGRTISADAQTVVVVVRQKRRRPDRSFPGLCRSGAQSARRFVKGLLAGMAGGLIGSNTDALPEYGWSY